MVTFDGHQYTFNGRGEYVLIETSDGSFSLQGRMLPVTTAQNTSSQATVYKVIVGKQNDSDTVQFEIIDDCGFIALVNGEQVIFGLINQQEFSNVVVSYLGNSTFSASFSSGAYVEVKEEVGIISVVSVSLPPSFEGNITRGLMGSFNGNVSDDLLPNSGQESLSLNSSIREIHELFGITCKYALV
jgi:deleted-in-malignant-brain-tumors protein 1